MAFTLEVYHTQERRQEIMNFPGLATGNEQWLGDGYYFWQDLELAIWWGRVMKCLRRCTFDVYSAELIIEEDNFLDTVFNENDYRQFIRVVEEFADRYRHLFNSKPNLEEFNEFISDFNIWGSITVIRFQDVPQRNELLKINNFFYKKRIQLIVREPELITNFALKQNFNCN